MTVSDAPEVREPTNGGRRRFLQDAEDNDAQLQDGLTDG